MAHSGAGDGLTWTSFGFGEASGAFMHLEA
jgi:hypothetical protein